MTIRIGVVEDERHYQEQVLQYLERYKAEHHEHLTVRMFSNADDLLEDYPSDFDVLVLDIQLKGTNGMDAAHAIRQLDEQVIILFVTAMPQYAIQGYSVGAVGYILKPLTYFAFSEAIRKAIKRAKRDTEKYLVAKTRDGMLHIPMGSITHIETAARKTRIHTTNDVHDCTLKMHELETLLPKEDFFRCHNSYFVNMRHVTSIKDDVVTVGNQHVLVSRPKRTAFMQALGSFLGGTE